MKIIQEGELPKPMVFSGKCVNCHAIVECEESEITKVENEYNERYNYIIKCPTKGCAFTITLQEGNYSSWLNSNGLLHFPPGVRKVIML